MEEQISAKKLLDEVSLKVIPMLEAERQSLFKQRVVLGLKPDERNIRGGNWSYPAPLTKEKAYLMAIDSLGGQLFQSARIEYRKLQKVAATTLSEYTNFQERVNKGFLLGRIIPKNALRLRKMKETFISVHNNLEGARMRYENRLLPLRTPEKRIEIGELSINLLRADQELQERRNSLDARFEAVQKQLRLTKALSQKLSKLGDSEISITRSPSLLGTVSIPILTTPQQSFSSMTMKNNLKRLTH